ncbi:MAG: Flp pilus assembly protein TadG [Dinoroseobacter sp.]|jgi:Flp pilus assembly protein TadG
MTMRPRQTALPKAPSVFSGSIALAKHHVRAFGRCEDGAILPYSLIMFILMLMAGGMAIDLMRRENARVILQNTVDRAVLAAADLDQLSDAEDVVNGYFDAAGLRQYLIDVDVDEGLNYRSVSAQTAATLDMYFLNMVGIETMTAPGSGTAEERIQNVEISLVVDISGSMGGSRMTNLKAAANEFIDTVISATAPAANQATGITSLSIIPYQAMVNIGDDLGDEFTLSSAHNFSQCVVFEYDDYLSTGITTTQTLDRMAHFEDSSRTNSPITRPNCETGDTESIIAYSVSRTDLKNKINGLSAGGNTAIDVGLKWGVALVDPDARGAINGLEDNGIIDSELRDRPAEYSDNETLKVIVLMTDGRNTSQKDLKPEFKSGLSNVWWHAGDDRYSVYSPAYSDYWYPHSPNSYHNAPYDGAGASQQLSMAELFSRYSDGYIASHFFQTPDPDNQYNSYRNAVTTIVGGTEADRRTRALCTQARNAGIVVFAIGFEAPTSGQNLMSDCAATPSHYFDVDGVEISEAFSAIARSINQLRLTQ